MSVEDDQCDDDKVAQRRDAILLRLLTMPPRRTPSLLRSYGARNGRSLLSLAGSVPSQKSAKVLLKRQFSQLLRVELI